MRGSLTYQKSGVDIDRANAFVDTIKTLARRTRRKGVLKGIGGFGAFYRMPEKGLKRPVLVSSADGVGTKLKCAVMANKVEGLGVDLVAMNVNDILTCGARPLFFLDYMSVGRLKPLVMKRVVKGIVRGCREADCSLIGGETAEMPGLYQSDDFDLAGFVVGVVDENSLISGKKTQAGDTVIGCASSGLHSNGFSLVRKVFPKAFMMKHSSEILRPTRIYVRPILDLIQRVNVVAMAHVTGGGFYDKVPRMLPRGLGLVIDTGSWRVPRVFKWIQEKAKASVREMYRTFNMGVGYVLVVPSKEALKTLNFLSQRNVEAWAIGRVVKGEGVKVQ